MYNRFIIDTKNEKNMLEYNVNIKYELLNFLYENVNNSKNNIKSFLKNGKVYVNGIIITKFNYILNVGDKVVIKLFHTDLDILYEDNDLIIVSKSSGLLTVSTENDKENTLYRVVSNYAKRDIKSRKVFIVNRLDKDTSGIYATSSTDSAKAVFIIVVALIII